MESYPASAFLALPSELRMRILQLALQWHGTIELQKPLWADYELFDQPLFRVCSQIRDEGLEAFYKTNSFLWVINLDHAIRSDPTQYPLLASESSSWPFDVTPALPWLYPHTFRHLRVLHVSIYLPSDRDTHAWSVALPAYLTRMIEVLDRGERLLKLHLLFTAVRYNSRIPLSGDQRATLDILSSMRIRGSVYVSMRFDLKLVQPSIASLDLAKRMKA